MKNPNYIFHQSILTLLIVGIVLAGCSNSQESALKAAETTANNPISPETEPSSFNSGGFHEGEAAQWPDYIPEDIPELKGQIRTVMEAPDSHIRIFYDNVSEKQVLEYLDLLESKGFKLEYRIYVQEGFPDNSEEKEKRGEFDAVDITKSKYHMNITYGANPIFDIYTSGFREEALAATAAQWPPNLPASVPQVPRCVLQTINPSNLEGYHISCRQEAENVEQEYVQLLLDAGFEEKNGTVYQNHVFEITVFENDEAIVIPSDDFLPVYSIQVIIKSEPIQLQWPEELVGLVPQPEQCEIFSITPVSSGNYLISCTSADENVLPDYLDLMAESGFEKTGEIVDMNDDILQVNMENNTVSVHVMNSTLSSNIMIRVETN